MRYFTGLMVAGVVALALTACAARPSNSSVTATAVARGASSANKSAWATEEKALEEQLRIQLAATDATIYSTQDGLTVRVPVASVFASDSTTVLAEGSHFLSQVSQPLKAAAGTELTIVVYGDSLDQSTAAKNFTAARALAVIELLQAQGIASARLRSHSGIQTPLVVRDDSPEGRRANRRLEIQISPLSF
jgi:outer membrane protein OmpA-like peptidoglycan-associated protein